MDQPARPIARPVWRIALTAILIGLAGCATKPPATRDYPTPILDAFHAAYDARIELPMSEQGPALLPTYQSLFAEMIAQPETATSPELRQLAQAAATMHALTGDTQYLAHHQTAVDRLHVRGDHQPTDIDWLYRSLVTARDLAAARALAQRHDDVPLQPLPDIVPLIGRPPGSRLVYRIDGENPRLYEQAIRFDEQPKLVAIVHPGCPFSRRALVDLGQDRDFLDLVGDKVLWLSDPNGLFHLRFYQDWQREHPGIGMVLPVDPWDWPFVHAWAFPTFLLVVSDQVVDSIQGWPKESAKQRAELMAMLKTWLAR